MSVPILMDTLLVMLRVVVVGVMTVVVVVPDRFKLIKHVKKKN